ncbi:MAG TPA: hypothetical protein VMB25_19780 [Bryobacteraceae bacterium]|nr:hypothetical protein [Bryobacteraceae bacterium]
MSRTILLILIGLGVISAQADTITVMYAGTGTGAIPTAVADRNAWILSNFGAGDTTDILESFENDALGAYTSLNTGAGTFSVMSTSKAGNSALSDGTKTDQFTILDTADSPFQGRFNTTPGGNKWLDSNDITQVQLSTTQSVLYFFITDVNDQSGVLTLKTGDGTTYSFSPNQANGDLYFVAIEASGPIGTIQWLNSSNDDGWGVDDFGTVQAATPEPSGLPLAAAGLFLVALAWKYKSRMAAK